VSIARRKNDAGRVRALSLDRSGRRLLSASRWTFELHDVDFERAPSRFEGHTAAVSCVAFAADQRRALSGAGDRKLKVWDLESARELWSLEGHSAGIRAVASFHQSSMAISGDESGECICWNIDSGSQVFKIDQYCDRALSNALSEHPWDVPTGPQWHPSRIERVVPAVESLAVSFDDRFVFIAVRNRPVVVWDVEQRREHLTLGGRSGIVFGVDVDEHGRRLVSAGDDGTVRVWNLGTGEAECAFTADAPVYCCAISHDGRSVVAGEGGRSGSVLFLRVEEADETEPYGH
jgi:WD40 repeat protein